MKLFVSIMVVCLFAVGAAAAKAATPLPTNTPVLAHLKAGVPAAFSVTNLLDCLKFDTSGTSTTVQTQITIKLGQSVNKGPALSAVSLYSEGKGKYTGTVTSYADTAVQVQMQQYKKTQPPFNKRTGKQPPAYCGGIQ